MILSVVLGGELFTIEYSSPLNLSTFLFKAIHSRKSLNKDILVPYIESSSKEFNTSIHSISFSKSLTIPSQYLTKKHCLSVLNLTKNKCCSFKNKIDFQVNEGDVLYVLLSYEWSLESLQRYSSNFKSSSTLTSNNCFIKYSKSFEDILPVFAELNSLSLSEISRHSFLFFFLIKIYQFILLEKDICSYSQEREFLLKLPLEFNIQESFHIDPNNFNQFKNSEIDMSPMTSTASSTPAYLISPLKSLSINSTIFSPSPNTKNELEFEEKNENDLISKPDIKVTESKSLDFKKIDLLNQMNYSTQSVGPKESTNAENLNPNNQNQTEIKEGNLKSINKINESKIKNDLDFGYSSLIICLLVIVINFFIFYFDVLKFDSNLLYFLPLFLLNTLILYS